MKPRLAPVGFAEPSGLITGLHKNIGQCRHALVFLIGGVAESVEVRRHSAAYERDARWHANRVLAVGGGETHPSGREGIEGGRLDERVAGAAEDARVVLIGHQEEHVVGGAACARFGAKGGNGVLGEHRPDGEGEGWTARGLHR